MKATYDPHTDSLTIVFSNRPVAESDKDKPGIIIDYDEDGNPVGIEILDASERITEPAGIEFHLLQAK
ncbi:DUF2283 domain-containing protein [Desulfofundulus thermobenzoicus]|uniref:DUF2283 domain-containing protein n=1 Tax=Desulfofundulus thermobenzoicus TaxID=29376 RepID=A0A6N7IMF4_9FIRM|nr:DUF2283 domain-containing protein [Desulfofundulus thermobenzoicus]MQL50843.1 DUF2283 domain-containing protein [Desulfofundulus thermobenzoicus]